MQHEPVRNRADLDALFAQMAQRGRELKSRHHDTMPFAMVMTPDGAIAVQAGVGEDTREILEHLTLALAQGLKRGDFKAVGLCRDAVLHNASGTAQDALLFDLEHVNDEVVRMFIPYQPAASGELNFWPAGRTSAGASFLREDGSA